MWRYCCKSRLGSGGLPADAPIFLYSSRRFCSSTAWRLDFPLRVEKRPPHPMATWAGTNEDSFFSLRDSREELREVEANLSLQTWRICRTLKHFLFHLRSSWPPSSPPVLCFAWLRQEDNKFSFQLKGPWRSQPTLSAFWIYGAKSLNSHFFCPIFHSKK